VAILENGEKVKENRRSFLEGMRCPECNGLIVLTKDSMYVCSECGLEESPLYTSPEHQAFSNEGWRQSQGFAAHFSLNSIDGEGSYIDFRRTPLFYNGKRGGPLPAEKQALYRRLKFRYCLPSRQNSYSRDYKALKCLLLVSGALQLSRQIRDRAIYLYAKTVRRCYETKEKINESYVLVAASIYLAVQEYRAPVTLREIEKVMLSFGHCVSAKQVLRASFKMRVINGLQFKARKSEDFLPRIISEIRNSELVDKILASQGIDKENYLNRLYVASCQTLNRLDDFKRGGKNKYILAVSTIYFADKNLLGKPVLTQKMLARIVGVSEWSIREHYVNTLRPLLETDKMNIGEH
jgi:transcription initiation factor TFIIIB Brf1 subunit/transcription initiation factor TFIIB